MSADGSRVAAIIVTHNSERFLPELIASIQGQTRAPDKIIIIDDGSSDQTIAMVREVGWTVVTATTTATDVSSRIAQNFTQGLRVAQDFDTAVFGDHDDYWLPDRVEHQVHQLQQHPDLWMLASGARIMGSSETLRDTFPIPEDWDDLPRTKRLRYALRHSIATGGACAGRPAQLLDRVNKCTPVPAGWLHDRWWSLAATARNAVAIDSHPVIEYRVQPDQQVGLDQGRQAARVPRIRFSDVQRSRDVVRLLR